ncbi:protein prune homolog 2-like isoform X2 [Penaeus chinensis]|uniref:protein prune homolog 2-like isoform X2 n=1 Tax=Penaeus chinensis TaxID=139456 RepID=UPI001FB85C31|nr:protein prune homolog 2-like isoform X2 [Penaeus chinensis]
MVNMNDISVGEGTGDPASEESMDVSEASNSSGTLANQSPLSDHIPNNIYSFEHSVRDPLRFPMQNGRLVGAAVEGNVPPPAGGGAAAEAAGGHRPSPFNLSHLEFSLPDTEIYEAEPVDFPSSPTALRSMVHPSDDSLGMGVRLAEREEPPQAPATPTEEDRSMYTAVVSPPTGQVTLRKERPSSLEVNRKKRLTVTEELLTVAVDDDQHSISSLSQHSDDDDDDAQMLSHDEFTDMLTPDDIDTPDELEESIMERLGPQPTIEPLPEYTITQETSEERSWRSVVISGIERRIDMKVIEPYKKVLSHGGYLPSSNEAIIVFSACFLPDRSRKDYDYVMDNLFMYVLTTLDQLIAEDYVLVYLHGATTRGNMPSFAWLKRCYQMIDRRLRKNLQGLYLVHPTFWVKTVVVMTRPFVSAKFARKLRFVNSLKELSSLIPMDQVCIPDRVKQYDEIRESLLEKA